MLRRLVAAALVMVGQTAFADTLDINLSNSNAQFKYTLPSGIAGKSDLFASVSYNDVNDVMIDGGMLVLNEEGSVSGLSLGIGAKVVAASLSKIAPSRKLVSGVALGVQARFELPADRRFAFVGEYNYAPRIISFGDVDHFAQAQARLEFAMSPLTQAYVGFRSSKFFMKNGFPQGVVDNGGHIGVRLSF
jgi:hypothetical protein